MSALDALARYDPMANRSARDINFENAVRFRAGKSQADLLNPGMPSVNRDPGWDAFDGGLQRAGQDAGDADMGFSVNMSGIGGPAGGGSLMAMGPTDPFGASSRAAAANMALGDYADKSKATAASLRALQAQARIGEDKAFDADWANDDVTLREKTEQDLERAGSIGDFTRGQQVKDAANTGAVYQAGQPARRAQGYDALQTAREMFPFGKESTELEKARIDAGAKNRESATNKAREDSAALRSLTDLARIRAGTPNEVDDPSGAMEGGFLGMGRSHARIANPAYDDLTDSMNAAYKVLGQENPGGQNQPAPGGSKVMSQQDLLDFAKAQGVQPAQAAALAKQYGWTIQ